MDQTDAIRAAMERRGMSIGATQQMTPTTPAAQPMPQPTDIQAASAALPPTGQPQPAQPPDSEIMIATKALATMVTNDSKMKKDIATMRTQGTTL